VEPTTDHHHKTGRIDPLDIREFSVRRDALRRDGRWADVARLLEMRGDAVDDVVEAVHCYLAGADVWERDAGEPGRAMECLQRVLRLEPDNAVAAEGLREFFREHGRYKDLLDLLLSQIDAEEAPHRRGELCLEVGQVYESHLFRGREAVRWYLRAYRDNPFLKDGALAGVQRVFESSPQDPKTLAALQEIYAEMDQWGTVAELLARRADVTDDAQRKADLLCELGELRVERLRTPDEALAAFCKAARLAPLRPERILEGLRRLVGDRPGDRTALRALREVYADLYRWGEVLELLEAEAEAATAEETGALLFEIGVIELARLFRTDRALTRFREAMEADRELAGAVVEKVEGVLREAPENAEARRLLAEAIALTGAWERLAAILTDGASIAARPAQRVEYICEAADTALEHLDDVDRAHALFAKALTEAEESAPEAVGLPLAGLERVLSADPAHRDTLSVLRDHYTSSERWNELVNVLEREAPLARGPRAQAELHYEIGHINEERLRRREAAMTHYNRAFKLNPEDIRYIDAGRRIYRRMGKWDMVVRLQELELQVTPERRADILLETAEVLHRRLDDPVGAFEAYTGALETEEDHEGALAGAKALLTAADVRGPLVDHLARLSRRADAAPLFLLVARLHEMEPADHDAALQAYRTALSLEPHEAAVFRRIEQAMSDQSRWQELVELYEQAAAREVDASSEEAWRVKASRVQLERLDDRSGAVRSLRQALEVNPDRTTLRHDLIQLLEEGREWGQLAHLYRWILENARELDPDRRREMLRKWAQLCRGPLKDPGAAAAPYRELLRIDPADRESLEYFRSRGEREGDPRELLAYLDAAVRSRPEAAPELLAEAASLCEHRLHHAEGAILRWEDLLRRRPGDPQAQDSLHRLYRGTDRWGDLVALLLGEAEQVRNELARTDLLRQAAHLCADQLRDPPRAEEIYGRILKEHPHDREALSCLSELMQSAGRWRPAVDMMARLARVLPEREANEMLMERARLLRDRLARPRDALADVRRVLASRPDDPEALSLAETLLGDHGDPRELFIMLGRRARLADSDAARLEIFRRMAELAEGPLGDPERAVESWRQVLELAPSDPSPLERLSTLHRGQNDWHALAGVLRRRVEAAPDPGDRVTRLIDLGETYHRDLSDLDRAREAYEAVLADEPDHANAMQALQEIFAEREDWEQLSEVLERRAAAEADPIEAVTVLRRLASIREKGLGDAEGAVRALDRARELAPKDGEVLNELRRVLGAVGEVERYVETIEAELEGFPDADAIELSLQAGRALRDELDRPEDAVGWYERILARDPSHSETHSALRALYERLGRADAHLEVLRAIMEQTQDDSERLALLDELAEKAEHAGKATEAFEFHRRAHRLAPGRRRSGEAMRRIAHDNALWEPLLAALQSDVVRAATPEKTALLLESARVLGEGVGDADRAFQAFRMAYTLQPKEGEALDGMRSLADRGKDLHGRLITALEELVDASADPEIRIAVLFEVAELQERALEDPMASFETLRRAFHLDPSSEDTRGRVEDLARRSGRWEPLLELYRDLQDRVRNIGGRVALHHEAAKLLEHEVKDPERAFDEFVAAFRLDPLDETTEAELGRLGESLGVWERLLAVFREGADIVDEPAARARFLGRAARVQEEHAGEPEAALETLLRALKLDPRAEETPEELERLARTIDKLNEVVAIYSSLADEAPPDLERVLRRRAVSLLEGELDGRMAALPHWARIWALDPRDDEAADRLTTAYRTQGRWGELLEIHDARIDRAEEASDKVALLFEVADIEQKRGDQKAAVAALEHILSLAPQDDRALEALEALHGRLGDPERVVHSIVARATRAAERGEAEVAHSHRMRAASWWDDTMGRPDQARAVYRELLDADPTDAQAAEALESLCERQGWWDELLGLLDERSSAAKTPEDQADLLLRMATIASERFDNRRRAVECLEAVLQLRPDDREAEDRLIGWFQEAGRWSDLLTILQRRLERFRDDAAKADLYRLIGTIQETRLFDEGAALEVYEAALVLTPDDGRTMEALVRLYRSAERWQDATRVGRALVETEQDDDAASDALFELARILTEHVDDEEQALDCWRRAVARSPHRAAELEEARRRAQTGGREELALALLELEEKHTEAPARRASLLTEIGRRAAAAGDDERAIERFDAALDLSEAAAMPALVALTSLHRSREEWPALDRCLERRIRLLEAVGDEEVPGRQSQLAEAWASWGKVALHLDMKPKAIERLYKALKVDPAARAARLALADLAFKSDRWKVAEEHYRALCQRPIPEDDTSTLAGWYVRLATCLEHMGHARFAAEAWQEALTRQPESLSARRGLADARLEMEQWEPAADALNSLLSGAHDLPDRRDLTIALGGLLTDHLERHDEALDRFEEAAALGGEDRALLERLFDGYGRRGDRRRAAQTAESLARLEGNEDALLAAHLIRGDAALEQDRAEEAATAFGDAALLGTTNTQAALGLALAREALEDLTGAAQALGDLVAALDQVGEEPDVKVWSEMARLRRSSGATGEDAGGDAAVRAWLQSAPDDPDAWRALIQITARDSDRREEHYDAIRSLLQRVPSDLDAYRMLLEAFQADEDTQGAETVAELLVFIKVASPEEAALVRRDSATDESQLASLPEAQRIDWVDLPDASGPVERALAKLLGSAPALFDRGLDELGASEETRADQDTQRALPGRFREVAEALGLHGRRLHLRKEGGATVEVTAGPPPAVVVGKDLTKGMFRREQRYVLAKALSLTRGARPVAKALHRSDGEALVDALRGGGEGRAEEWRALLEELLDEELLQTLEEELRAAPDATFEAWAEAAERSSARAALVLCGDLGTALQAQRREAGGDFRKPLRNPGALADLVERSSVASDLLQYALSSSYLDLQRWFREGEGALDAEDGRI
jgi:tetratricopeptide (TPR) repeat protein